MDSSSVITIKIKKSISKEILDGQRKENSKHFRAKENSNRKIVDPLIRQEHRKKKKP